MDSLGPREPEQTQAEQTIFSCFDAWSNAGEADQRGLRWVEFIKQLIGLPFDGRACYEEIEREPRLRLLVRFLSLGQADQSLDERYADMELAAGERESTILGEIKTVLKEGLDSVKQNQKRHDHLPIRTSTVYGHIELSLSNGEYRRLRRNNARLVKQKNLLDKISEQAFAAKRRATGERYATHLLGVEAFFLDSLRLIQKSLLGYDEPLVMLLSPTVGNVWAILRSHDLIEDTKTFVWHVCEPVGKLEPLPSRPASLDHQPWLPAGEAPPEQSDLVFVDDHIPNVPPEVGEFDQYMHTHALEPPPPPQEESFIAAASLGSGKENLEKYFLISDWEYVRSNSNEEKQLRDIIDRGSRRDYRMSWREGAVLLPAEAYEDENLRAVLWRGIEKTDSRRYCYAMTRTPPGEKKSCSNDEHVYLIKVERKNQEHYVPIPAMQACALEAVTKNDELIAAKKRSIQEVFETMPDPLAEALGKAMAQVDFIDAVCERLKKTPTTDQQEPIAVEEEVFELNGRPIKWSLKASLLLLKLADKLQNLLTVEGMPFKKLNEGKTSPEDAYDSLEYAIKAHVLGCAYLQEELKKELSTLNEGLEIPLPVDVARLGMLMLTKGNVTWLARELRTKKVLGIADIADVVAQEAELQDSLVALAATRPRPTVSDSRSNQPQQLTRREKALKQTEQEE